MTIGKITKRAVDAVRPGERDSYLWDSELAGFGLKVSRGGARTYLVQYRIGGRKGRTRRVTLGQHGSPWTPDMARAHAKRLLGEVAAGGDPAELRARERASGTIAELSARFLAEHAEVKRKPSTAREYRRLMDLYVLPALGQRKINDVARADVARLHQGMVATPYQANRVLAVLSKLMNWCERHGLRTDGMNPCRHVEKYRENRRERFLSEIELGRLGEALAAAARDGTATPWAVAAIRLLALTGARLNEILSLRWEQVAFERATLRLHDSKTGPKSIYLNPPALEVLANLPRLDGNPYVICGQRGHLVNLAKPWRRIRKAAQLDNVRMHDLRHSFASVGAAGGLSLPIIGRLLGHSQPQTTDRYAHLSADPLRAASEVIANRIAAAMKGENATVVPLARNAPTA